MIKYFTIQENVTNLTFSNLEAAVFYGLNTDTNKINWRELVQEQMKDLTVYKYIEDMVLEVDQEFITDTYDKIIYMIEGQLNDL